MRVWPVTFPKTLTVFSYALVGKTVMFETSDGLYWAPNKRVRPCPEAAKVTYTPIGARAESTLSWFAKQPGESWKRHAVTMVEQS